MKIAIEPERDANQRRDDEPQSDIEGIHSGIPSFFLGRQVAPKGKTDASDATAGAAGLTDVEC